MAGSIEETNMWLAEAAETLAAARELTESGFHRDAVSRAYYAMFYAAKAALVSQGIETKKHSG